MSPGAGFIYVIVTLAITISLLFSSSIDSYGLHYFGGLMLGTLINLEITN